MPLPGGLGPQSPVKFVVTEGPFANGQCSPIGSFVAAAPQLADYALVIGLGFFCASAVTPQGQANAAEYTFGAHAVATHNAEAAKTKVWGSLRTPPVVLTGPVPPLVLAFPQVDLTRQGSVFSSVRTPPVVLTGQVTPLILASPQSADLSISGWVEPGAPQADGPVPALTQAAPQTVDLTLKAQLFRPQSANQGRVPQIVFGSQADPSQIAAKVWPSQAATPVIAGVLGASFYTLPQNEERPTRQTWAPLNGARPPVIASIWAGPQQYDLTQQAVITAPAIAPVVVITGVTVFPIPPIPPQFDTSVNPSIIWTPSTFSPSLVVSSSGGGQLTRYRKKYHLRPKYLRDAFEIRREEQFLADIQERIEELAGIVDTPAETRQERKVQKAAEIKLLSNVNALAKSYSVEIRSIEQALALIEQRTADLADEEALAIILIAANL